MLFDIIMATSAVNYTIAFYRRNRLSSTVVIISNYYQSIFYRCRNLPQTSETLSCSHLIRVNYLFNCYSHVHVVTIAVLAITSKTCPK